MDHRIAEAEARSANLTALANVVLFELKLPALKVAIQEYRDRANEFVGRASNPSGEWPRKAQVVRGEGIALERFFEAIEVKASWFGESSPAVQMPPQRSPHCAE